MKKEERSLQQMWFGAYFANEMEAGWTPDIILRYIDAVMGWGVFAGRAFKKMEFIAEYSGILRKRKRRDRKNAYCFEYAPAAGWIIDAESQGNISRFINHSKEPNLLSALATVENVSRVILITDKAIQEGEQLSYDYGSDYWSHRQEPQRL